MKHKTLFILPFLCVLIWGELALAQDDSLIRARATLGWSSYELTLTGRGSNSPDAKSDYPTVGGGLSYAKDKFYIDTTYAVSLDARHDWEGYEGKFKREDTTFTVGYLLENNWSAFAGYKWGKSKFSQDNLPGYSLSFEVFGWYVGGSKVIPMQQKGSLVLSVAVASMKGEIYDTDTLDDTGEAVGTSYSIGYSLPLQKKSGLQFRSYYQKYKYSKFATVVDIEEDIFGLDASFYLNF
ncbi:MAG: hypothetical protein OEY52_06055 [Gammaproteobacteria bacterium]|nr:hypothetical protein [Gammaproteobacteria bacterium]